jgi:peptidoglycan/xylan/chitin deacetylase (PgdA/CDA1 family)
MSFPSYFQIVCCWLCLHLGIGACTSGPENASKRINDPGKEAVLFIYHRFGDARYPSTNIALDDFEDHLQYLAENEFMVMTLGEAVEYLHDPEQSLKERVAVLTIDDGFATFYTNAMPLLKRYGFNATLFINPESIGGADYMSWEQLKLAMEAGIEIGNHSYSHDHFLNYPMEELESEFKKSVLRAEEIIGKRLGITTRHFAYPYGEFNAEMALILEALGYESAVGQFSGVAHPGTEPFAIPRFSMVGSLAGLDGFAEKAHMGALRVRTSAPGNPIVSPGAKPVLRVVFQYPGQLEFSRLQCFIQGAACATSIVYDSDTAVVITPGSGLRNRRHLYTITVPDTAGHWRWYSRLWVLPAVKE